jgi:ribosomal protein S7
MRKFLNKKNLFLKDKTINLIMKRGKKTTGEKILLKFVKSFQKSSKKKFIALFQASIMNTTPVFSVNTQVVKKGKRKFTKDVPSFLSNHSLRISNALSFLKQSVNKEKKTGHFYKMFAREVLASSLSNSSSTLKKNEVQKQVLLNKRYWSNFKW